MKLPVTLFTFLLVFQLASAQGDSIDPAKSTIDYIRESKFREASLVLDARSHDVFSFFVFEAGVPINAAYAGDTLCQQFFDFNAKTDNQLSPFSRVIAEMCRYHATKEKHRKPAPVIEAILRALSGKADVLTGYAAYVALRPLDLSIDYDEYIALQRDLRSFLRDAETGVDQTALTLKNLLLFNISDELLFRGISTPDDLLQTEFPLGQISSIAFIPFLSDEELFIPVFEQKLSLVKFYSARYAQSEQQRYALTALIDSPSKKHAKAVMKLFGSRADYLAALQQRFNEKAQPVFNERTMAFIAEHRVPGRWMVVDLWGTWCSPCIEELPQWQRFHEKQYEKAGFVALSVGSKDAAEFLAKNAYTFPAMDLLNEEVVELQLSFYPSTFLLSPEGNAILLPARENKLETIRVLTGL